MTNVLDFGAKGDGKADDTLALQHAIQKGDGHLILPRGDYLLKRPLSVPLEKHGRFSIHGQGGIARLVMIGPGPALHLIGTHNKTADPASVQESVWQSQRMPTILGLEIVGRHAEADGIRLDGVMQPTFHGLLIRQCRHGVHLVNRNRNVILSDSHIYDCSGIGLFLDRVNLHQINVTGCHISYCKQGGIVITKSEIRNIQICGCDIEYNFDRKNETSADILFDGREGTIREGAITGNTIQAKNSPQGANVRLLGVGKDNPAAVGLLTITGNLIGSQETAVHLRACRGVLLSGNCIYSGYRHALLAEDCEHLVINGNSFDHNPDYKGPSTDQLTVRGCRNVNLTSLLVQHIRPAEKPVDASLEISDCQNVNLTGCQILGARGHGVLVRDSTVVRVADCTVRPRDDDRAFRAAVCVEGRSAKVLVLGNFLARGNDGDLKMPAEAGIATSNVTL